MKTIKVIFAALVLTSSSICALQASTNPPISPEGELRERLIELLSNAEYGVVSGESFVEAKISFIVNARNEIVVLDVDTEFDEVDNTVKRKLNYKKAKVENIKVNKPYQINLKIQ